MPTYEYECKKCGHFEEFQSITAAPLTRCPKCHGKVHRLLGTGSGIIFKGSGFYETDYKHDHCPPTAPSSCEHKSASGCACGSGNCPHKH